MNGMASRRTVLRGLGVSLVLPFLESIAPRRARAQTAESIQRYLALYFPVGVTQYWWPKSVGSGAEWQLPPILQPLQALKPRLNVYSGLENARVMGSKTPGPSHSRLCASFLTCSDCFAGDAARNNVSIDQLIAAQLRGSTSIDSLQVGLTVAPSDPDQRHPANSRSISWASPTRPLYKVVSPPAVFDALMTGRMPAGALNALAEQRRALGKSSLDFVLAEAQRLQRRLSGADSTKLSNFLDSVRDLERRAHGPAPKHGTPLHCPQTTRPAEQFGVDGVPYSRPQHFEVMSDLVVLALQCDMTRVVSFMLDDARSSFVHNHLTVRTFDDAGSVDTGIPVAIDHHSSSHIEELSAFSTVCHWFAQCLARISEKLLAVEEGDRTLLDNTLIIFGSGIEGPAHRADRLPVLTVGSVAGQLKTNQHFQFTAERPLADLHLTLAQRFGVATDSFANSSGQITELLA